MDWISLPKIIYWNVNAQGDCIRKWRHWVLMRSWGWRPHEWNCKRHRRELPYPSPLTPLLCEDMIRKWQHVTRKRAFTRNRPHWYLYFALSASRIMRNKFLLFISHSDNGTLHPELPNLMSMYTQIYYFHSNLLLSFSSRHMTPWNIDSVGFARAEYWSG